MLSKCANPHCSSKFRYLREGKLFLLNFKRMDCAGQVAQPHYAWLCDLCTQKFEVVLDAEDGMKIRARYDLSGLGAALAAVIGLHVASAMGLVSDVCELVS